MTLIGKPECHLCDDARAAVHAVRETLSEAGIATEYEELSIGDDPGLERKYREDIPVVLLDGRRHSFWRVDRARLAAAIERRSRSAFGGFTLGRGERTRQD